jgi:hypothetical protein
MPPKRSAVLVACLRVRVKDAFGINAKVDVDGGSFDAVQDNGGSSHDCNVKLYGERARNVLDYL